MIVDTTEVAAFLGLDMGSNADIALITTQQAYVERAIQTFLGFDVEQQTRVELLPTHGLRECDESNLMTWDVVGNRAVAFGAGGNRVLTLTHAPVRSIVSLYEDRMAFAGQAPGAFAPDSLLSPGLHYYLDEDQPGMSRSGQVIRLGSWPSIPRTVQVTYLTGYTADEINGTAGNGIDKTNIKLAVIKQMQQEFLEVKRLQATPHRAPGLIQSESLSDWSVTYQNDPRTLPGTIDLLPSVKQLLAPEVNISWFR